MARKLDKERADFQHRMGLVLRNNGVIVSDTEPGMLALWELVEVHYASKCFDHEAAARAHERAKLAEALDGGEYECPEHGNQKHGKEAERLRRGIEQLSQSIDDDEVYDGDNIKHRLQNLLDEVDAADSLAFLERHDDALKKVVRDRERDLVVAYLNSAASSAEFAGGRLTATAFRNAAVNISGGEHRRK